MVHLRKTMWAQSAMSNFSHTGYWTRDYSLPSISPQNLLNTASYLAGRSSVDNDDDSFRLLTCAYPDIATVQLCLWQYTNKFCSDISSCRMSSRALHTHKHTPYTYTVTGRPSLMCIARVSEGVGLIVWLEINGAALVKEMLTLCEVIVHDCCVLMLSRYVRSCNYFRILCHMLTFLLLLRLP